jgi:hypothetical protein
MEWVSQGTPGIFQVAALSLLTMPWSEQAQSSATREQIAWQAYIAC